MLADEATIDTELATFSLDELEEELAELAAHIYAGTCRSLELVAERDRRGGWAEAGCGSCAEWLAWRCALLPRAAREHVRVPRRLRELPKIQTAFARGELSDAKVRALTRVAEAGSEEELLELARYLTAAQLEQALRAYRRVTREEARDVHEHEYLTSFWDEDGSLVLRARLAPEEGALFLAALEAARDSLWQRGREEEGGSAEPPLPASHHRFVDAHHVRHVGEGRRDEHGEPTPALPPPPPSRARGRLRNRDARAAASASGGPAAHPFRTSPGLRWARSAG